METKTTTCKNCEKEYQIGFEFCPHCGQKTNEDLTVGVLFYNTISNYFSFDARFFKSFFPLMFKPGILAKRFIEGKRLLYLHPAQMYLFISVVFFFLFSFVVREQALKLDETIEKGFNKQTKNTDSLSIKTIDSTLTSTIAKNLNRLDLEEEDIKKLEALDSIISVEINSVKKNKQWLSIFGQEIKNIDSLIAINAPQKEQLKAMGMKDDADAFTQRLFAQALKFQKNKKGGTILQTFYDSVPIALFILLPIFAMLLKLFFWKRGRFAHHLVFSFYYYSFLFTVLSILLLLNFIWDIPNSVDFLIVLSTFFYLFFAIKQFYMQGYLVSFIKACAITFMYMIFVIPIAFVVMASLAFLLY